MSKPLNLNLTLNHMIKSKVKKRNTSAWSLCCAKIMFAFVVVSCSGVQAHEMRPAYLEIRESAVDVYDVVWKVPARGINERFGLYLRFADDVETVGDPITAFMAGSHIERKQVTRTGGLTGTTITIDGLAGTFTDVLLRIERLDGTSVTRRMTPVQPSYLVEARPGILRMAWNYTVVGMEHILVGIDHLLFVLGLMLIVKDRWTLVKTITSFTVAHSITLAIATLGFASAPLPPLNAAIALSILFLGPEIVRSWRGESSLTIRYPWIVAFVFGLLHGFGFASGLTTTGMPASEVPLSLLLFNVGVELGQLSFVFLALALAWSFRTLEVRWPKWVEAMPGYAVGSLGAFWTIERTAVLLGVVI